MGKKFLHVKYSWDNKNKSLQKRSAIKMKKQTVSKE